MTFREDITNRPEFQHFQGKCLELRKDVFLIQYSDSKIYSLEAPGSASSIPPTVEAYVENPKAWTQEIEKVIGVVPRGTKLHVNNIVHMSGPSTSITHYFSRLDDPRFNSIPIDVLFLLRRNSYKREFDIDDKYLRYCE